MEFGDILNDSGSCFSWGKGCSNDYNMVGGRGSTGSKKLCREELAHHSREDNKAEKALFPQLEIMEYGILPKILCTQCSTLSEEPNLSFFF